MRQAQIEPAKSLSATFAAASIRLALTAATLILFCDRRTSNHRPRANRNQSNTRLVAYSLSGRVHAALAPTGRVDAAAKRMLRRSVHTMTFATDFTTVRCSFGPERTSLSFERNSQSPINSQQRLSRRCGAGGGFSSFLRPVTSGHARRCRSPDYRPRSMGSASSI